MNCIVLALLMMSQPAAFASETEAGIYLMGRPDSAVKIELFSDFECPACRTFFLDTIMPLLNQYSAGNQVAVLFHDFPLPSHVSAKNASLYALASASLGREQFLKIVSYLYTCQAEWAYDGKIDRVVARVLAPDEMARVREKLKDPELEKSIAREIALGKTRQVESTPTFFFSARGKEQRVVGGLSFSSLNAFIAPSLK